MERMGGPFSSKSIRGYRLTIITQLLQAVEAMHTPEEMFQWLAYAIVQRFDISILQFWTRQSIRSGQPSAQLRAVAFQDRTLPAYMISEKVTASIEQIPKEPRIFSPQLVERTFPHFQASLLKRYGLNYCSYCLIDRNDVGFAPAYALSNEKTSIGLTFIAFLLLRNYSPQDLMPTISSILEQAVGIAEKHHLLFPVMTNTDKLPLPGRSLPAQEALPQEPRPELLGLIPRQKQDERLLVSSNPFASSVNIPDNQARRLYAAIDGRKTVDELHSIGMTRQEVIAALQILLNLNFIEMYTPEGQHVDAGLLFRQS
jgi:hypothetical protein